MKLDIDASDLGESGAVQWFPVVCPHCHRCYWYQPNDLLCPEGEDSECARAIRDEAASGVMNIARVFWQRLITCEKQST